MQRISIIGAAALAVAGPLRADVIITEIMYDPASAEGSWEWIEILNTGSAIDFVRTPWVIDDANGVSHDTANIFAGEIPAGGVAVLYDADDLLATEFADAWDHSITLVPVAGWSAMAFNNGGDTIGIWSSFDAYDGDHETHEHAEISITYDDGETFPVSDDSASIHLVWPFGDPTDGASWALSVPGVAGAYLSNEAGGNSGADVGSPGLVDGKSCLQDCGVVDGRVDVDDLVRLLEDWGAPSPCDLDGDDMIDVDDLLTMLEAWGDCV